MSETTGTENDPNPLTRRCRCGGKVTEDGKGCVWHTSVQAEALRELADTPDTPDALIESSVGIEAHDLVYGKRQGDYGHPREDFTRTAILWTGLLQHKLADGEFITPEDYARCMVAVKLSRDVHSPKRDNRVDMAGYAITLDRLETGR